MATIYDVAKAAGVSPKTVSRVLNGDGPVGETTRAAVQDAIQALGYVRSSAARAMRSNKSGLIGLITGAISKTPRMLEESGLPALFIVQGVQKVVEAEGLTLLISDTGGRQERVPQLLRTFAEHRVEGVIYVADWLQPIDLPALRSMPHKVIANGYDGAGTPSVVPDDRAGQHALTCDLIAAGHRRIAYLSLSPSLDATRLRTEGYRQALSEAGIDFDPALVIDAETPDVPQNEVARLIEVIDQLLGLDNPPTVLAMGNDRMAMRAYGILRSKGFNLPEDISIAGYDNDRMLAETLYPPLTTVALPYLAMGQRAAEMLFAGIRGEEVPTGEQMPGPVCWRESVADISGITR